MRAPWGSLPTAQAIYFSRYLKKKKGYWIWSSERKISCAVRMINEDIKEQKMEDRNSNPNKNFICSMEIKWGSSKLVFLFYRHSTGALFCYFHCWFFSFQNHSYFWTIALTLQFFSKFISSTVFKGFPHKCYICVLMSSEDLLKRP